MDRRVEQELKKIGTAVLDVSVPATEDTERVTGAQVIDLVTLDTVDAISQQEACAMWSNVKPWAQRAVGWISHLGKWGMGLALGFRLAFRLADLGCSLDLKEVAARARAAIMEDVLAVGLDDETVRKIEEILNKYLGE